MAGTTLRAAALALAATVGVNAAFGVDTAGTVTTSQATCLAQANVTFAVVRALHSTGAVDTTAASAAAAFKAAGVSSVGVYAFPCPTKSASTQISAMMTYLKNNAVDFDTVWLDIETNPTTGCGACRRTLSNHTRGGNSAVVPAATCRGRARHCSAPLPPTLLLPSPPTVVKVGPRPRARTARSSSPWPMP